jgi:outer membrane protein insertion porin family
VRYIRSRIDGTKYHNIGGGWIVSAHAEGGYIAPLQKARNPDSDAVRLTDRFFDPGLRGFDIRGIGPRIQRVPYNADGTLDLTKARTTDALGGRAYYMGRLELEFPVTSGLKSLGLRPSAFIDVGSLWKVKQPALINARNICTPKDLTSTTLTSFTTPAADCSVDDKGVAHDATLFDASPGFQELFLGNSPKPRLSIGVGVNWVSPFGPLRIDIAKALLHQKGDDTKLFSFNVGTQF